MTPSKLWYAQKLATLRNDGSKAEDLAEQMTIRRLCYEIEKLEVEEEEVPNEEPADEKKKEEEEVPEPPPKKVKAKSFWARVALETSSDEEN
jgi:hypothetical protein